MTMTRHISTVPDRTAFWGPPTLLWASSENMVGPPARIMTSGDCLITLRRMSILPIPWDDKDSRIIYIWLGLIWVWICDIAHEQMDSFLKLPADGIIYGFVMMLIMLLAASYVISYVNGCVRYDIAYFLFC